MEYVCGTESFQNYINRFGELFHDDAKYVIFGTAQKAARVKEKVSNLLCYVDNDSSKWGKVIDGVEIKNPEVLKTYPDVKIIVASSDYQRIFQQLRTYGIAEECYCNYREKILIKDFLEKGSISVPEIYFVTNNRCTLACKGCIEYVPYIEKKRNFPLEDMKASVDNLFNYVDKCELIAFSGGEALLHEDLAAIIQYAHENYVANGRVQHIRITSNATVIPNESVLQMLKKYDVFVVMSDYRKAIQNRCKIEELSVLFEQYGIRYGIEGNFTRLEPGKWYDMGNPHHSYNMTVEELKSFYAKCTVQCTAVWDSKLFNCNGVRASIMSLGWKGDDADYCDLKKDSKLKFLKYYLGYNEKGYYDFCNNCNGFGEVLNHTAILPGEQG